MYDKHRERLKRKRRYNWGRDMLNEDSHWLSIAINTPKICSCYMCANPRKIWKEKTLKERIEDEKFKEEQGLI